MSWLSIFMLGIFCWPSLFSSSLLHSQGGCINGLPCLPFNFSGCCRDTGRRPEVWRGRWQHSFLVFSLAQSCGWAVSLHHRPGPVRRPFLNRCSFQAPITASPFALSDLMVLAAPHSYQPCGIALNHVSLKLACSFANSPFIKSSQMTSFKRAIWVPAKTLTSTGLITTCFCSRNLSWSLSPTRVCMVFQLVFWFWFPPPPKKLYSFCNEAAYAFLPITQKFTREKFKESIPNMKHYINANDWKCHPPKKTGIHIWYVASPYPLSLVQPHTHMHTHPWFKLGDRPRTMGSSGWFLRTRHGCCPSNPSKCSGNRVKNPPHLLWKYTIQSIQRGRYKLGRKRWIPLVCGYTWNTT